jgi:hypothetical protein
MKQIKSDKLRQWGPLFGLAALCWILITPLSAPLAAEENPIDDKEWILLQSWDDHTTDEVVDYVSTEVDRRQLAIRVPYKKGRLIMNWNKEEKSIEDFVSGLKEEQREVLELGAQLPLPTSLFRTYLLITLNQSTHTDGNTEDTDHYLNGEIGGAYETPSLMCKMNISKGHGFMPIPEELKSKDLTSIQSRLRLYNEPLFCDATYEWTHVEGTADYYDARIAAGVKINLPFKNGLSCTLGGGYEKSNLNPRELRGYIIALENQPEDPDARRYSVSCFVDPNGPTNYVERGENLRIKVKTERGIFGMQLEANKIYGEWGESHPYQFMIYIFNGHTGAD